MPCLSRAQDATRETQQRPPKQIEPPHKPAQQGFRLTATIGLTLIGSGKYSYNTTLIMPDGSALDYQGTQRSGGGTLSLGVAATPPGALRRFTIGFDLNFGGVDVWAHPVIPAGLPAPQQNLNARIGQQSITSPPWRPFFSPYIEHELGSIFQNRIRLGYQYWQTTGSYQGSFTPDQGGSARANYNVRFSQASNMIRLSVHNDTWLDDTEIDHATTRRRSGIVQQGGVLIGTDRSIIVFVGVGPVWSF
ncbi:MAG TPA: hypothetical protein VLJ11_07790 [Bryobacteraceae bacterium]|nr:hypothetical protein [Bryobacteraceae bacterium]